MSGEPIPNCLILGQDDYTFYASNEKTPPDFIKTTAMKLGEMDEHSLSFNSAIEGSGGRIDDARLQACSCFHGKLWSVTVRSKIENRPGGLPAVNISTDPFESKYQASKEYKLHALFSIADICASLEELLFEKGDLHPHGAVIVTGATSSGKSQITMGLIYSQILRCIKEYLDTKKRKPHLVTVENPIEDWFLADALKKFQEPDWVRTSPIDYTPRQLGADVGSVHRALRDALRQTPSAVFISEIRDDCDWKSLMGFAGTGHLIFATGHAGSLPEAMGKILKALRATTPADRAVIAERIHGLIHVKRETFGQVPGLMLTLWRRKGAGKQAFVSEGLSALAPQAGNKDGQDMSSFGRFWFAEKLLNAPCDAATRTRRDLVANYVLRKARELDLEGR